MTGQATRANFAFVDTETTGLEESNHRIWEIGAILRGPSHETDLPLVFHVKGVVPGEFEEAARRIGRFDDRYGMDATLVSENMLAWSLQSYLAGRYLVGANPAFDQAFLKRMFFAHGLKPSWHHRLIDVEVLAMQELGIPAPMGLRQSADALGLVYDPESLHSAFGDADLARRIYDLVVHGTE